MFRTRPDTLVGLLSLAVAATVAVWNPNGVAQMLSWVLAGTTLRFLTLPGPAEAPGRPTGGLIAVPFFAAFFLLAEGVFTVGKLPEGELARDCGTILFCEWLVLLVWESRAARRRARAAVAGHGDVAVETG